MHARGHADFIRDPNPVSSLEKRRFEGFRIDTRKIDVQNCKKT